MFQCINQLFAFSLSFIHFPFEKVGIYVTNTGLMATYGGPFTLTVKISDKLPALGPGALHSYHHLG
ncbi:hypothetical protein ARF22_22275 [Salmonella enterica subsp. enterica serovar Heidelberg]|uniref:Uncharacterized protein n=6 Tax=Enterobacteriaceae TaxID=543 RepID=A0A2S7GFA4_ECOLX|nr:hypothetical protein CWB37_19735 [Escherichia coli]AZZ01604.1 hypothetical protein EOS97_05025 [Salmonella sp. SSDFZ54]EAA1670722.1 hypothetical protein [Salmonella enterica subsp. enterica serovar Kentucky]EAA3602478.1 hypothetical protein [Salmonella enterica subsp. enterica serovar Schwarzengrund]EAB5728721.1 hypothetical protein [Salmonella enterica subsp. enterica serovar Agona]EAN9233103.1 hypothetical protein [Salmonella enterica]EAX6610850.1 hypothetical protein [Salmonella enteric